MSTADLLKKALSERFIPSAITFARKIYARVDPSIIPTLAIVVVPTKDVDWAAFAIGLPSERAGKLLDKITEAVSAARVAEEKVGGLARMLGYESPGYLVGRVVRERNDDLNLQDSIRWSTSIGAAHHLGFDLVVMLGVPAADLGRLPHVEGKGSAPEVGLAQSLTTAFLRCVVRELGAGDALLQEFRPREDADDLLRDAGEDLVYRAMTTLYAKPLLAYGRNVFEQLNQLASLRYEGSQARGSLVFASLEEDEGLPMVLRFAREVPLTDPVWARKMIELCTQSTAVVSDDRKIFGVVQPREVGVRFSAEFLDSKTWRLRYGDGQILMEAVRGVPRLPRPHLSREVFAEAVARIFPSSTPNVEALWHVVEVARAQAHGTMVVISSDAAAEAGRLASQATPIEPATLNDATVESATRIDGAVLLDPTATCHAIGVILDGDATPSGNPARGARFNSGLRYTTSSTTPPSLAVVLSEDGHVDLLPRLRPQIRRSDYDALVALALQEDVGGPTPPAVSNACCRLAYDYADYLEEEVLNRVFKVVCLARGLFSDDPIWGTYDLHHSDIIID